ncbi:MAG: DUF2520 domain-containing protein [Prevotellaceae bacterium]|jgi:predicted short-subunit dehydrogenase-like oxidoreductase (DUF2520 family)|nr:DUF2520 domain-containing protein [Prevotellaceae bacterium]
MNIAIVGAGNLASSLAPALVESGQKITRICSRTFEHAKILAQKVNAMAVSNISDLGAAKFYILATPDSELEQALAALPVDNNSIVMHVSGSTSMSVIEKYHKNCGVLYPLQTFSTARPIADFSNVPLFIEANSTENLEQIYAVASKMSKKVVELNSAQRLGLHISAVFACNFVNSMLACSADICHLYDIDFGHLQALVQETVDKAFAGNNPAKLQTGPAKRRDLQTIDKHIEALRNNAEMQQLYEKITKYIINTR